MFRINDSISIKWTRQNANKKFNRSSTHTQSHAYQKKEEKKMKFQQPTEPNEKRQQRRTKNKRRKKNRTVMMVGLKMRCLSIPTVDRVIFSSYY